MGCTDSVESYYNVFGIEDDESCEYVEINYEFNRDCLNGLEYACDHVNGIGINETGNHEPLLVKMIDLS